MRFTMGLVLTVLACRAAAATSAQPDAAPLIYIASVAPFVYEESGHQAGVVNDLLTAMAQRAGLHARFVALPFYRLAVEMEAHPQTLAAVWRTADKEQTYDWQTRLFDDRMLVYARAGSTVDLSSIEALRRLRVGVVLGGVPDVVAHGWGLAHIEATNDPGNIARKLDVGRIDAWLAVRAVAAFGQMRIGAQLGQLRQGGVDVPVAMYLACARRCDPALAARWTAALEGLRRDGSYERILRRYYFTPSSSPSSPPSSPPSAPEHGFRQQKH
jgi:polar amino acid transport system substrate-binding protein